MNAANEQLLDLLNDLLVEVESRGKNYARLALAETERSDETNDGLVFVTRAKAMAYGTNAFLFGPEEVLTDPVNCSEHQARKFRRLKADA